mmetsp:Transcript_6951/g.20216  ORF Transcript_6951/g.20216 Transcript_6951/m.20216 type:complete len:261 (+) Transcript_6951:613-1395(+)
MQARPRLYHALTDLSSMASAMSQAEMASKGLSRCRHADARLRCTGKRCSSAWVLRDGLVMPSRAAAAWRYSVSATSYCPALKAVVPFALWCVASLMSSSSSLAGCCWVFPNQDEGTCDGPRAVRSSLVRRASLAHAESADSSETVKSWRSNLSSWSSQSREMNASPRTCVGSPQAPLRSDARAFRGRFLGMPLSSTYMFTPVHPLDGCAGSRGTMSTVWLMASLSNMSALTSAMVFPPLAACAAIWSRSTSLSTLAPDLA